MKLIFKLNIAIFIIFFVSMIILFCSQLYFQYKKHVKFYNKIEKILSKLLEVEQEQLIVEILENQEELIRKRLKKFTKIEDVELIALFNAQKQIVFMENIYNIKKQVTINLFDNKVAKYNNKKIFKYIKPIYSFNRNLGYIVIYYSLSDINSQSKKESFIIINLFIGLFLVFIVLLNIIIHNKIIKPVNHLKNTMENIDIDGPCVQTKLKIKNEIGDLLSSFNQMSLVIHISGIELKKTLEEKETLFKELHHRVKNNLNMLLGMIELQIEYETNEEIIYNYKKFQDRIYSISLIYKLLYKRHNINQINIKEYLLQLVNKISNIFNLSDKNIKIITDIDNYDISIDTIKSCGIIINELITNSIKHAFHNNEIQKGEIYLSFKKIDNEYQLLCKDNGNGLKKSNLNFKKLGLNLVKMLCYEINGQMTMESADGLAVKIIFPVI